MTRVCCVLAALFIVFAQWPVALAQDDTTGSAVSGAQSPSVPSADDTKSVGDQGAPSDDTPTGQPESSGGPGPEGTPASSEGTAPQTSGSATEPHPGADTLALSVSGASIDFGSLEPGATRTLAGPVLRVTSGRPFDLAYRAHGFQRGVSISHLSYRHEGGYVPFSSSGMLESNHQAGTYEWQEMYQLQLGFDVPAGDYDTSITYTATPR